MTPLHGYVCDLQLGKKTAGVTAGMVGPEKVGVVGVVAGLVHMVGTECCKLGAVKTVDSLLLASVVVTLFSAIAGGCSCFQ